VGARAGDESVDEREIELAFGGFEERPGDGGEYRVQVHGREARPDGLHVVEAGGGVVEQLAAEDEERLAIHE